MISNVQEAKAMWTPLQNSSIVTFHNVFSTQDLGDSSLIAVSDYHPNSATLAESYSMLNGTSFARRNIPNVPEKMLWNYIVQISNSIRAMHSANLAPRLIDASKMLLTDEGRVLFNGCALADILDSSDESLFDRQRKDLVDFGDLIIWLATVQHPNKAIEMSLRNYHPRLTQAVQWLQQPPSADQSANVYHTIENFISMISSYVLDSFDATLNLDDTLHFHLNRELENSRMVRLLIKIDSINERPEYEEDPAWQIYGSRGQIKLFRDYVFHQVDNQGRPVLNMGHIIACMNKLDVGIDEKIQLTTRDNKNIIIVTYREMKQLIEGAWSDLRRRSRS